MSELTEEIKAIENMHAKIIESEGIVHDEVTNSEGLGLIFTLAIEKIPILLKGLSAKDTRIRELEEAGTKIYFNCDSHYDSAPGMAEWRKLTGVHPISSRDDSFELWKARQEDKTW